MGAVMDFPDWSKFTPEFAEAELGRLIVEAERNVAAIEADGSSDYESLVDRLDDATRGLWRCWGAVSHLMSVMNDENWRQLEERWQPKIVAFSLRVSQSPRIYALVKALAATELTPTRRRIVERMVRDFELAGVGLDGERRERFNAIQTQLARLSADFQNAVIDATTPEIADAAYIEAMKHDPDRAKRERLYRARTTRAPENAKRIDEILSLRRELAALLGYADYAELSLATKCAPSVAAVTKMIDELDIATRALAEREKAELGQNLMPWDVTYEAERLRERKYAYSEDELKQFFELEDVIKGLFAVTKTLFGADVEEVRERPSTWHDDVRFFAVREGGEIVAHFYFDPYVRTGLKSGGAWMNEFRNRNDRRSTKPLAVVVTNFPKPDENGRCLLPFREVETLFHEFGHALQCMLTRIGEEDAAGINLVEWDAVEVASQFMENWCLDDRTGIRVPAELKAKVRAAKNFRSASACRRQLSFAATDMALHGDAAVDADAVKCENFRRFGMMMIDGDRFLCAFTHIFAGGYAAGYYGYKWAEVMSADCYGAFEEAGLDDDAAVVRLGRRFRETVLGLGGSKSALQVFRDFRGRDPEIGAMIRQQFTAQAGE